MKKLLVLMGILVLSMGCGSNNTIECTRDNINDSHVPTKVTIIHDGDTITKVETEDVFDVSALGFETEEDAEEFIKEVEAYFEILSDNEGVSAELIKNDSYMIQKHSKDYSVMGDPNTIIFSWAFSVQEQLETMDVENVKESLETLGFTCGQ